MSTQSRTVISASGLAILAVLFIALTMLLNVLLPGARLDLTENQLYTISEGTKNIVEEIEEPINLYFYFSNRASENVPFLRTYATRVRELIEELAARAGGKLKLQVIDPLPFSEEEDDASRFGLQAVPVGAAGETVYFGLAGTNAVDDEQVIPFFDPNKETFLEYDIARLIYTLDNPERPVIGLLTGLPMSTGFDPATQQLREPWAITSQIEELFDVRNLASTVSTIEEDIDVLMVVHPKSLSDETLYAIDQFVLRGGRAMLFVDPFAEADIPPQDPSNPSAAMFASRASNLDPLFAAWGIAYDDQTAVLDSGNALAVGGRQGKPVIHLAFLGLDQRNLNGDDVVTADLSSINVAFAGYLQAKDGAEIELVPLLTTGTESMTVSADRFRMLPDPGGLLDDFVPDGQSRVIAARVRGKVKTAYPGGLEQPDEEEETAEDDGDAGETATDEAESTHLEESVQPINLVVVADTDLLTDRLWVQVQNFFGQRLLTAFANNADMVINGLDNLTGSSDLISIRGRATFSRPFDKVDELRRKADADFRATEQRLQDELRETERKLGELQSRREDDNPLIMTAEQRREIDRFQAEKLRIRKDLRQVRRNLDRDIERLGTVLKLVNIVLVPLAVVFLAVALFLHRSRRSVTTSTAGTAATRG